MARLDILDSVQCPTLFPTTPSSEEEHGFHTPRHIQQSPASRETSIFASPIELRSATPPDQYLFGSPETHDGSLCPKDAVEEHFTDLVEGSGVGQFNLRLLQSLRDKEEVAKTIGTAEGKQAESGETFAIVNVYANPPTSKEIVALFEASAQRREQHIDDLKRGEVKHLTPPIVLVTIIFLQSNRQYFLKSDALRLSFRRLRADRRRQLGLPPSSTTSLDSPSPSTRSPSDTGQATPESLSPSTSTLTFSDVDTLTPRTDRFDHHIPKGDPFAPIFLDEVLEKGLHRYKGGRKLEFLNQYWGMVERKRLKGKSKAEDHVGVEEDEEVEVPEVITTWFSQLLPGHPLRSSSLRHPPLTSPMAGLAPLINRPSTPSDYYTAPSPRSPTMPTLHIPSLRPANPPRLPSLPENLNSACPPIINNTLSPHQRSSSGSSPARATVRFAPLPPLSPPSSPSPVVRPPKKRSHSGRPVPTIYAYIHDSPVRFANGTHARHFHVYDDSQLEPVNANGAPKTAAPAPFPHTTSSPILLSPYIEPHADDLQNSSSQRAVRTHPNPLRSHIITAEGREKLRAFIANLNLEHKRVRDSHCGVSPNGHLASSETLPSPAVTPQRSRQQVVEKGLAKDKEKLKRYKGCPLANKVVAVGKARVVLVKKGRGGGKVGVVAARS